MADASLREAPTFVMITVPVWYAMLTKTINRPLFEQDAQ